MSAVRESARDALPKLGRRHRVAHPLGASGLLLPDAQIAQKRRRGLARYHLTRDVRKIFGARHGKEKALGDHLPQALGYREPPTYIRPVGETEGAAMLAAHQWADAKGAFERALVERPHSGLALYGIALASEKAGNREAAVKSYADFLSAWNEADSGLPQIAHARAYVTDGGR